MEHSEYFDEFEEEFEEGMERNGGIGKLLEAEVEMPYGMIKFAFGVLIEPTYENAQYPNLSVEYVSSLFEEMVELIRDYASDCVEEAEDIVLTSIYPDCVLTDAQIVNDEDVTVKEFLERFGDES